MPWWPALLPVVKVPVLVGRHVVVVIVFRDGDIVDELPRDALTEERIIKASFADAPVQQATP